METKNLNSVPDQLPIEAGSEPLKDNCGITSVVTTAQQFIENDADYPTPIVDNLIYEGTLNLMVGPPKGGKSTTVRNLIKSIVDDKKFLNQATSNCKILYVPADEPSFLCKDGLRKLDIQNLDSIIITKLELSTSPLADIIQICKATNSKLVIIDLMVKAVQLTDLNSYDSVMQAFRPFREATEEYGISFLFLHHTPKSNQYSALGSQAISGVMDNILYITLENKCRYFETDGRFSKLEKVELTHNPETDQISVDEYYGLTDKQAILHALRKNPDGLSKNQTITAIGRQKDRILKLMKEMEEQDYIKCNENGTYSYVAQGFRSRKLLEKGLNHG